ncbi:MAG: NfeD family protein [Candidatus Nanopelagicales bacterium]
MDPWVIWVIVAGVMAIAEVFTAGLLLIFFAGGAAAAAVASALGVGEVGSAAIFAVTSVALIGLVRPIAARNVYQAPLERSGTAALIGTEALVLERVDGRDGRVKIGGEIWSARTFDPYAVFEPGQTASVMEISGAFAVIG